MTTLHMVSMEYKSTIKSQTDSIVTIKKKKTTNSYARAIPNRVCATDHKSLVRTATDCISKNKCKTQDNIYGSINISNMKQEAISEQQQQEVVATNYHLKWAEWRANA